MLPVQQFISFIHQHQLFNVNDHVLLAVSGGKDSVLMAHLFKLAGFNFSIAHCNFNLRGDESQRDEAFSKLLAATMEVTFHVKHFDTKTYAVDHHLSTQMAARELRYNWFQTLCRENSYRYIALAQHQNDAIETVLLNLVRGTGISGLHGILPKRGNLIRPLLFLAKKEIDELIAQNGISFVEDSSNQTDHYARNNIRLNVVPHLQAINPNLARTFVENMKRFAETEAVLKQVVSEKRAGFFISSGNFVHILISEVKKLHPQKLLFFELLQPYHFSSEVIDEILNALAAPSGTSFYSKSHRITIDREKLILSVLPSQGKVENQLIHLGDELVLMNGQKITMEISDMVVFNSHPNLAYVDFDLLIFPLVVRFKQDGDRFMPLGMSNSKKISDFFIQEKVPLPKKQSIPLIINGNGEVIWIAGMRQDERYKVTATTKKVAIFELLNPE